MIQDLTGQTFGRLQAVSRHGSYWLCHCECGTEKLIKSWPLTSGRTRSCGCLFLEVAVQKGEARLSDLTDKRFGRLTVIDRAPNMYPKVTTWNCLCDCGVHVAVASTSLQQGRTNSCGCLRRNDHDVITYEGAHWRVRQAKGPPTQHRCADCTSPAAQWSYDYSDPEEVICTKRNCKYSLDPDRYVPRCTSCHKVYDLAQKVLI